MVYSADAHFTSYSDTGLFSIFFGTEPRQLSKCISIIENELERLSEIPIGVRQLSALKEQLKGHLALSEENNLSLALMMGRSVLDFGRVPSLQEIYDRIDNTDSSMLRDTAHHIFRKDKLSYLIMEPARRN
jgi:predicted Zn-dependent peptidase